jgi:hypothetical protein
LFVPSHRSVPSYIDTLPSHSLVPQLSWGQCCHGCFCRAPGSAQVVPHLSSGGTIQSVPLRAMSVVVCPVLPEVPSAGSVFSWRAQSCFSPCPGYLLPGYMLLTDASFVSDDSFHPLPCRPSLSLLWLFQFMEPWTFDFSDLRTLGSSDPRTLRPRDPRTLGSSDPRTVTGCDPRFPLCLGTGRLGTGYQPTPLSSPTSPPCRFPGQCHHCLLCLR